MWMLRRAATLSEVGMKTEGRPYARQKSHPNSVLPRFYKVKEMLKMDKASHTRLQSVVETMISADERQITLEKQDVFPDWTVNDLSISLVSSVLEKNRYSSSAN